MPCCDAYIPPDALSRAEETTLIARVTAILVDHEMRRILDLMTEPEEVERMRVKAASIAWTFVHKVETYVSGALASLPHYRFVVSIPEGQIDERFAPAINRDILSALRDAEGSRYDHLERRVWVHIVEIVDGHWGAGGRTLHLKEVVDFVAKGWGDQAVRRWHEKKASEASDLVRLGTKQEASV